MSFQQCSRLLLVVPSESSALTCRTNLVVRPNRPNQSSRNSRSQPLLHQTSESRCFSHPARIPPSQDSCEVLNRKALHYSQYHCNRYLSSNTVASSLRSRALPFQSVQSAQSAQSVQCVQSVKSTTINKSRSLWYKSTSGSSGENSTLNPSSFFWSTVASFAISAYLVDVFNQKEIGDTVTQAESSFRPSQGMGLFDASALLHQDVRSASSELDVSMSSLTGSNVSSTSSAVKPQVHLRLRNIKAPPSSRVLTHSDGLEKSYDVSVKALRGHRLTMEDDFFVAGDGRFVAVFDGHGGSGVSRYLKQNLYDALQRNLILKHWEETELFHSHHESQRKDSDTKHGDRLMAISGKAAVTDFKPSVSCQVAALRSAFAEMERDVLNTEAFDEQGSTAVAVLVHENDDGHRILLSANVGDSRAILSRNRVVTELTRDHKPNDEREKARILQSGELIEWDRFAGVHRVRGLSLSRAIGDRYAKPVVSSEVEISHFPIIDSGDEHDVSNDDEFILLASDGLWDVMSSNDVVQFVHNLMDKKMAHEKNFYYQNQHHHHNSSANTLVSVNSNESMWLDNQKLVLRKDMSRLVAREAIRLGSADNVCVVIVWLNDLKRNAKSTQRPPQTDMAMPVPSS